MESRLRRSSSCDPPSTYQPSFHGDNPTPNNMQYRRLGHTDMRVSYLGFGASALGSVFRKTDDQEAKEVVMQALKGGINYIDTAPWYGHGKSETVLGEALKDIPRDVYYIATKVGRYQPTPAEMFDFSYERTLRSVNESLSRLGLKYVDIIQVHDLEFAPSIEVVLTQTLPALQRIKAEGKARYIGITGYPLSVLKEVATKSTVHIDTVLTYCRYSMNDTTLLQYKDFFIARDLGIINASPLSMGLLSNRGPPSWHPASQFTPAVAKAAKNAAEYCQSQGIDISRLALLFSIGLRDCSTCLVSTASKANLQKNLDVVRLPLTASEQRVLDHVMETYMKPLNNANWEGLELAQLKIELKKSPGSFSTKLG